MQLNDQQQRALNKYGYKHQMLMCASELSELAGRIFQMAADIERVGFVEHSTAFEATKEFYDVKFTLPQFEAALRYYSEGYEHDMKAIAAAEVRRMEDRLAEE